MEPRVLDTKRASWREWLLAVTLVALAAQARAAALQDIRTEIRDPEGLTRCVVVLNGETEFLQRDYLAGKKYFLVDIYDVSPPAAERFITPASGPVRQILVLNRKDPDERHVLTLVFYLTDLRRYRVFPWRDPKNPKGPYYIVVDVWHSTEGLQPPVEKPQPAPTPALTPTPPRVATPSIASPRVTPRRTPATTKARPTPAVAEITPAISAQPGKRYQRTGKKIVIIDPWHGGGDSGAESYVKIGNRKIFEKDINLAAALDLKRLFDASPNVEAFLTRDSDRYVSLADRQQFAERRNIEGDLFLSIHCDASDSWRSRGARGIGLYYLNPSGTAKGSLRYLEEIENRNGGKKEDVGRNLDHPIFTTLAKEAFLRCLTEGKVVCEYLKTACYQIPYYQRSGNRQSAIQSAFFRVLFQADMPAVLVEIGFITNATECEQLADPRFRKQVATALYNGTLAYFKARDERFVPKYLALQTSP